MILKKCPICGKKLPYFFTGSDFTCNACYSELEINSSFSDPVRFFITPIVVATFAAYIFTVKEKIVLWILANVFIYILFEILCQLLLRIHKCSKITGHPSK